MKTTNLTIVILVASFVAVVGARAQEAKLPPASTKENLTYATDIKPIFDASCVKCHSGDRAKARLHMDTLAGVLKGTKAGKIIKVGESANSFIIKCVAHLTKDRDSWMPPMQDDPIKPAKPLTPEQIGLLRAWIDQGAK